jgi:hypothetical protein
MLGGMDDLTLNDFVARIAAIGGLAAVALIHALQLPDAFVAVDYLGVLFVIAIVACVALAALLTRASTPPLWMAVEGLSGLILIGYLLSRLVGLPGFTEDVGEWTEPLGLASMVAEGLLVCISVAVLSTDRPTAAHFARRRGPGADAQSAHVRTPTDGRDLLPHRNAQ